ncbi:hypothetical protein CEXT_252451 [Caerostris extrusa]|uniref:Uncharacterized protein n=1 Tax=Caerostris extrusa TaxID=172846 RepID=A0AAV4MW57_CAEEX|nr:hypothetical protein CEXT_252451 [Caerostris extrusa]
MESAEGISFLFICSFRDFFSSDIIVRARGEKSRSAFRIFTGSHVAFMNLLSTLQSPQLNFLVPHTPTRILIPFPFPSHTFPRSKNLFVPSKFVERVLFDNGNSCCSDSVIVFRGYK